MDREEFFSLGDYPEGSGRLRLYGGSSHNLSAWSRCTHLLV